jgi:hypothetical protein
LPLKKQDRSIGERKIENFKKELSQRLLSLIEEAEAQLEKFKSVRSWCETDR